MAHSDVAKIAMWLPEVGLMALKTVLHILNVHILASLLECLCHCQRWF
jgi:hypothetical protein